VKIHGDQSSNVATRDITVVAKNDAPVLTTVEILPVNYTENEPAVIVTNALSLSDVDDTQIESALVVITGNFNSGEDQLIFTDTSNISGSYNAATGILSLTGSATAAQYEAALQTISYQATGENLSTLQRTVSFTVNDGDANSNTASRDINITAVNDAPVLSSIEGSPVL